MQLLFESSDESIGYKGLAISKGKVISLSNSNNYRIPRIGWADSKINFDFLGLKKGEIIDFYYIHSYYVKPDNPKIIAIETDNNIIAAIQDEHIFGCQFHPEKSHISGLDILKNFVNL